MLTAPLAFDFVQTYLCALSKIDFSRLNAMLEEMEEKGKRLLMGGAVGALAGDG